MALFLPTSPAEATKADNSAQVVLNKESFVTAAHQQLHEGMSCNSCRV